MPQRLRIVLAITLALPLHAQVSGGNAVEATPQRPSFSTDTSTTTPGTVELEFGTTLSDDSFAQHCQVNDPEAALP